jgi:tripartite-type tricarboxylate transporter receptor subunit TctC
MNSIGRFLTTIALAFTASGMAQAQTWPDKPIRFVVPWAPGGVADAMARLVAKPLSERLGQPIVVDNRPGAGGNIGSEIVAKAAPDGYTLVIAAASHATTPGLYRKMRFDAVKDFAPITQIVAVPWLVVVHSSVPANNIAELVALGKTKRITFGSGGTGSSNHLAGELFRSLTGIQMDHIAYKGSAPALNDLLGGQINMMFDSINTSMPHVRTGALKALAVTGATRTSLAPDLPTVAEAGVGTFEAGTWIAMMAPANTPRPIIDRLQKEVRAILFDPALKEYFAKAGVDPVGSTPEQFGAFLASEVDKWSKVVTMANVPPAD